MSGPFWQTKTLDELSPDEWEALCDGCGKCCLVRLFGPNGGIYATSLSCRLLDTEACRCASYGDRSKQVSDCVVLTPQRARDFDWLPATCAYRLRAAGEPLPPWHHLVCGDREAVHREGMSVRGKVTSELEVPEEDWDFYLIEDYKGFGTPEHPLPKRSPPNPSA